TFLGCERAFLSHTGYTGEPGLEIYCEPERVEAVWEALLEAGAPLGLQPAGLGARDTPRLEAGYCLYGHELTERTTPLEAGGGSAGRGWPERGTPLEGGVGWVTRLGKGECGGRGARAAQTERGARRRRVGLVREGRGIPRQGYAITDAEGAPIGEVTSGSQ